MGQCRGCVRYVLFIFNFAMWLLGCALLSVGIWIKMDDSAHNYVQRLTDRVDPKYQISYSSIGDEDITTTLAYVLIVFGIILIIITFIGCCGAVRENTCLLITYCICLLVLMCALIGIGVWANHKKDNLNTHTNTLKEKTDNNIEKAVEAYYDDEKSKAFMDNVQQRFQCCGMGRGLDNYRLNQAPALCIAEPRTLQFNCKDPYFKYVALEIEDFLRKRYTIIAAICFAVAICLGLGIIFTFLLCCIVRQTTVITVN